MLSGVYSQYRGKWMKPESEQGYPWEDLPTLSKVLASPLSIVLMISVALMVGGALIMINQASHNRQTLEQLRATVHPQTIQALESQNQWSIEDRKTLHEQNKRSMDDRAYLHQELENTRKNQASIQRALENAQKSFNEARDELRLLRQQRHQ